MSHARGMGAPHCPRSFKWQQHREAISDHWARCGPKGKSNRSSSEAAMDVLHVAQSKSSQRQQIGVPDRVTNPCPILDEDKIELESFFGQLWEVPKPHRNRVR
jgi:hypothetical protein